MYKILHYNHSQYGLVSDFFTNMSILELIIYIGAVSLIGYLINKK